MARLSLRLLGPFQVTLDGQPVTAFETDKEPALLAYLAAEPDHAHRREALAELLWPNRPEGAARANLRHVLAILRRAIGDREDARADASVLTPRHKEHQGDTLDERADKPVRPYLLVDHETVQFSRDSDAWVDVLEFTDLTGGERVRSLPEKVLLLHLSGLEKALALYRGPFLEGLSLSDNAAYEEWLLVMRERWQRQAMDALQRLTAHWEQRGEYERALAHARRQVELEPWQEEAQRALMRLLAITGQRSAALRQYAECDRALRQELDVAPAQETVRLYEQIRDEEGLSGFPNGRSLPAPDRATVQHNLPAPVTSFVGRERELADPQVRLITVVGAGGMGKTRLALEATRAALTQRAALDQAAFAEAWLVELAPIVDAAAAPRAVAAALGVHEQSDRPLSDAIAGALQGRKLLLLLDNCEHVLVGVAPLVAVLLGRCPDLTVLSTSREPLRVPGEHLYETPPLGLPELDEPAERLCNADAVQLLVRRAVDIQPQFALDDQSAPLAAEICRRLDGMPLAIELAVARLCVLSLPDLARHIDDRFRLLTAGSRAALPRQQTLRNTVAWSYDLLTEGERMVFDRLSVFAGGFSLEAVEQVCSGDGVQQDEVLDLLAGLVDKSLVTRVKGPEGATRYRLLETLRAYGLERLDERGEANVVSSRHAWFYVSLAEAEESVLWACERGMISARKRLDLEAENLAAAMRWSLAHGQPEIVMRIGGALYFWTYVRANNEQYAEWLRLALAQGEQVAPLYRAKAWWVIGTYFANWGRQDEQAVAAQTVLDLARAAEDATWIGRALVWAGRVADMAGDHDKARSCYEQGLALTRQCGDRVFATSALLFLACYEPPAGRRTLLEELIEQAPHCQIAWLLPILGWTTVALGDLPGAQAQYRMAVAADIEQDSPLQQGESWSALAGIAAQRGDYPGAEQMWERGRDLFRRVGAFNFVIGATWDMGRLAWQRCDLGKASARFQECLDLAREHHYSQDAALACVGLALVAGERGEHDRADALCEQALPDLSQQDDESQATALCAQGRVALLRGEDADQRRTTVDRWPSPCPLPPAGEGDPHPTSHPCLTTMADWSMMYSAVACAARGSQTRRVRRVLQTRFTPRLVSVAMLQAYCVFCPDRGVTS